MSKKISTKTLALGIVAAVAIGYGLRQTADVEQVAENDAPIAVEQAIDTAVANTEDALENAAQETQEFAQDVAESAEEAAQDLAENAEDAAGSLEQESEQAQAEAEDALNELAPAAGSSDEALEADGSAEIEGSVE